MDKLIEKLKNIREAVAKSPQNDLATELREIKSMLRELLLAQEIASIKALLADLKGPQTGKLEGSQPSPARPDQSHPQALEQLAGMTPMNVIDGVKHFLLHRASGNQEYENSIDNINYTTKENTEWMAEGELADASRIGKNPVISCFIPETSIQKVAGQGEEVGALDGIGKNPTSNEYRITVTPGTYTIYRQIKAMS